MVDDAPEMQMPFPIIPPDMSEEHQRFYRELRMILESIVHGIKYFESDVYVAGDVNVTGKVGIGTTSPTSKLYVENTANDTLSVANSVASLFDAVHTGGLFMQQTDSSPYGFALQAGNIGGTSQFPLLLNPLGGRVSVGGFLNLGTPTELTIDTGVVTATKSYHTIDTESDAGGDDLDTISGGTDGDVLILRTVDDGRDVVLRDGTGNLILAGGADFTLDKTHDLITLVSIGGTSWVELSRSNNS